MDKITTTVEANQKMISKSSLSNSHKTNISRLAMPKNISEKTKQIRSNNVSSLSEMKKQLVKASTSKCNDISTASTGITATRGASPTTTTTTQTNSTIVNKKVFTNKKKLTENNCINNDCEDENKTTNKKQKKLNSEIILKNSYNKVNLSHSNELLNCNDDENKKINNLSLKKQPINKNLPINNNSNIIKKPSALPLRGISSNLTKTPANRLDLKNKSKTMVEFTPAQTPNDFRRPLNSAASSKSSSSSVHRSLAKPSNVSTNRIGTASAKAATTLLSMQKELDKHKRQLDSRNKQIQTMRKTIQSTNKMVLGLSCVIRYLNEDLNAFATPELKEQIRLDELKLVEKTNEINILEIENNRVRDDIVCWQIELQREQQRNVKCKDDMFKMFESERKCIEMSYQKKLNDLLDEKRLLNEKINNLHKKNEKLNEDFKNELNLKDAEIDEWRNKFIDCEMKLNGDKDVRIRKINEQCKYLTEEVNSLKAVLELKEKDLKSMKHKLNCKIIETDDIPKLNQQINIMNQKIEQLEISLKHKNDLNIKLQKENEYMNEKYASEAKISRRLSMKNEELEYALSETLLNTSAFEVTPFKTPKPPGPHFPKSSKKLNMINSSENNGNGKLPSSSSSYLHQITSTNETFIISDRKMMTLDRLEETGLSDESSMNNNNNNDESYDNNEIIDYNNKEKMYMNNNDADTEDKNEMLKSISKLPKCVLDSGFGDL